MDFTGFDNEFDASTTKPNDSSNGSFQFNFDMNSEPGNADKSDMSYFSFLGFDDKNKSPSKKNATDEGPKDEEDEFNFMVNKSNLG